MCDLVLVSAGISLLGAGMRAGEQEGQAREEAGAMRDNAFLARLTAGDATQRGMQDAARYRTQGTQVIGQQRAAFGASGVDGSTGSPAALAEQARAFSELDAQTMQNNAAREAWGYQVQAQQLEKGAKRRLERGQREAFSTFLGGIGSAAGSAAKGF